MNIKGMFNRPEKFSASKPLSPAEQAAKVWDDREGHLVIQAYNWRRISIGLLLLCIVLTVGLVVQSVKSSVVPYIIEVDRSTGVVKGAGVIRENEYTPQNAEIKYFLGEFIKNTREVPLDPIVYKNNWTKSFYYLTQDAAAKMQTVAQQEKVSEKFGVETVQVTINSILPIENSSSYHVNWTEESFTVGSGQKMSTNMTGVFTITLIPAKDEETLQKNPLGIYISDFNYTREQPQNVSDNQQNSPRSQKK